MYTYTVTYNILNVYSASDILGLGFRLSGFVRRQFISLKMYFPYMHILVNTVLAEVLSPPVSHLHRKKKKTVNL